MTKSERQQNLTAWVASQLGEASATLERASSDASFRSYWRVCKHRDSYIVMDAPPDKEDVRPWLDVAQRLRAANLNAPEVLAQDLEQGFLLIGDLGTRTYLPQLNLKSVDILYNDALNALFIMQSRVQTAGLPLYDEPRLVAELELFPTWFLQRHLGHTLSCGEWDVVEAAFRLVLNSALAQPLSFVHRDYHSRNLLVTEDNNPGIIDFQDAVVGPITYDLVSLLRDCYVAWPQPRVETWVEEYRQRLHHAGLIHAQPQQFRCWFDLMGLQRHIKVLGIFCRLWYRDGKSGYLSDLPLVLHYTLSIAKQYPELIEFAHLVEHAINGRDVTQVARQ